MLSFTDIAKARIQSFLEKQKSQGVSALRVAGNPAEHKLWLVKETDKQTNDHCFDAGGFDVFIDPLSATSLEGSTVDFIEDVMQSGFRIFYPSPTWDDATAQRIQDVLDKQINPGIASHGGKIHLEKLEKDTVYLSMAGGCQGCASAQVTLSQGVEQMIKAAIPAVKHVVDVTNHAEGQNPYYASSDAKGDSPLG